MSDIVNHGCSKSIYFKDPNGLSLEYCQVGLYEIRSVYISKQEGGTNELDFLTRPLGSVSV